MTPGHARPTNPRLAKAARKAALRARLQDVATADYELAFPSAAG